MSITVEDLKNIFGAQKAETQPTKEELDFLDNRAQIEADSFPLLSIEQYEQGYEQFCEYGLEDKMLQKVAPHIRYLSRFEPNKLLNSTFYKRFKDEKIVKQYVQENIEMIESESE